MINAWMQRISGALVVAAISMLPALAAAGEHSHAGHNHSKSGGSHAGHNHADHHLCEADIDMPKDFATAVARIKKCRAAIGEELAEGHLDEVHEPLDEATIILGKLMPLARDSGVPKAQWQELNVASKDLRKRLADIHTTLDKQGSVDFKKAAPPIDQSIRRLESIARSNHLTTR